MHIMIDLETMGTRPDAPIIAIGAVQFNETGLHDTFYCNVDLESAVHEGHAVVDPKTVLWWLEQGGEARSALREDKLSISLALSVFADWLGTTTVEGMWGNGASFDNIILAEAYRRLDMEVPWPFWLDRCYRTVKATTSVPFEREGVHHNALDDAKTQAKHLLAIWHHGRD